MDNMNDKKVMSQEYDIQNIIENDNNLDAYEKKLFKEVLLNLKEEQKSTLDKLRDRIIEENKYSEKNTWNIVTALVPVEREKEAANYGLCPYFIFNVDERMLDRPVKEDYLLYVLEDMKTSSLIENEEGLFSAGVTYLDCKYSELDVYLDKDYCGYAVTREGKREEIRYRLELTDIYINQERVLERTAAQNEIERPYIYSPFSRRAVVVYIETAQNLKKDFERIELELDQNGLGGVLMAGNKLMWNLSVLSNDLIGRFKENTIKKIIPYFGLKYVIYDCECDENEYVFIDDPSTLVKRIKGNVYLGVEGKLLKDLTYYKVKMNEVLEGINNIVTNNYIWKNEKTPEKLMDRIRTEGDVRKVLNILGPDLNIDSIGYKEGKSIKTYETRRKYYYPVKEKLKSSSIVYLKFTNGDSKQFEDKVSYIMDFMNYYYPEYTWVGIE